MSEIIFVNAGRYYGPHFNISFWAWPKADEPLDRDNSVITLRKFAKKRECGEIGNDQVVPKLTNQFDKKILCKQNGVRTVPNLWDDSAFTFGAPQETAKNEKPFIPTDEAKKSRKKQSNSENKDHIAPYRFHCCNASCAKHCRKRVNIKDKIVYLGKHIKKIWV